MIKSTAAWVTAAIVSLLAGPSAAQTDDAIPPNDNDESAIRALLTDGFETTWNSHEPAAASTPDKCQSGAVFINVTGAWLKGCENWAALITPLHAPGGLFHDHTRRHVVEDLQFIRADVAIAVVRTLDIKRGGVATAGEETRGLVVVSKHDGRWKLNANQNARIQVAPAAEE
jgi:uncharacterized protein (TIGR02246 family)